MNRCPECRREKAIRRDYVSIGRALLLVIYCRWCCYSRSVEAACVLRGGVR